MLLQVWLDYGVGVFLILAGIVVFFLIRSIRFLINKSSGFIAAAALANLFFILHAVIDIDLYMFQASFIWFLALGILYGEITQPKKAGVKDKRPKNNVE